MLINVAFGVYAVECKITGCILSLCDHLSSFGLSVRYWAPTFGRDVRRRPYLRPALSHFAHSCLRRLTSREVGYQLMQYRFLHDLRSDHVAWLWPRYSVRSAAAVRQRCRHVFLERVNSSIPNMRRILNELGDRHGVSLTNHLTANAEDEEAQFLEIAHSVFAPSPFVADSLVACGVSRERILTTSYGWDPHSFQVPDERLYETRKPVFLFVGYDYVRKGLLELLAAWGRAKPDATLKIVSAFGPDEARQYGTLLNQPGVTIIPPVSDLSRVYAEADVFTLPSHEEGSPLVTYLAAAAGLPSLVSIPGSGGVIRDGFNGLIRDPYDIDGMAGALHSLASDAVLRERLGRAAKVTSRDYTWAEVARRRGEQFRSVSG